MKTAVESGDRYFDIHVFCCVNERAPGHHRGSCSARGSIALQEYMKAVNGEAYEYDSESASFGVSYMLVGDIAVDNNEPFNQDQNKGVWVAERPHLMLLLPASMMKDLPTDPYAGGPYVMWEGNDFVHVMVPLEVTEPLK